MAKMVRGVMWFGVFCTDRVAGDVPEGLRLSAKWLRVKGAEIIAFDATRVVCHKIIEIHVTTSPARFDASTSPCANPPELLALATADMANAEDSSPSPPTS